MDPQNHTTAVLTSTPQNLQSFNPHYANSHVPFHSSVYSLYPCPRYPDAAMPAARSQRTVQPPRPPNAWILYRSEKIKQLPAPEPGAPRRAQADVSKMISRMWQQEDEAVKAEYEKLADVKKAEHHARYPHYRFQPMKKADKEKLREQSKADKERETKKPRRAAPYPSPAPHASSSQVPAYFMVAPPPVSYATAFPQATAFSESNAPSPPLSAASSNPSSPNSFPTLHLDPETPYTSVSPSPADHEYEKLYSVPSNDARHVSSTMSTGFNTPSFSGIILPTVVPTSQGQDNTQDWSSSELHNWGPESSSTIWTDRLFHEADVDHSQVFGPELTIEEPENSRMDPPSLSLDIPSAPQSNLGTQQWSAEDLMQIILSATMEPAVFQIAIDSSTLTSEPQGNSDFSHASLGDPMSSSSWFPDYGVPHTYSDMGNDMNTFDANQVNNSSDAMTLQYHEDMLQYLDFSHQPDMNSPATHTASSSRSASHSTPVASSSTYVPPAGAVNAGRRVVAGSWKFPGLPSDQSPPNSPIEPVVNPWSLRAAS